MTKSVLFLLVDDDETTLGLYRDGSVAATLAEERDCYVDAVFDVEGDLVESDSFWRAALVLSDNSVVTERCSRYKYGSAKNPCRDGCTFAGHVVSQEFGYIVAWGVTKEEAIWRVRSQAAEGRKRAARDAAREAVIAPERPRGDQGWDPYGLWMSEDLKRRAKEAAERAYMETA